MSVATRRLHRIEAIVLHHSASPPETRVETIRRWHTLPRPPKGTKPKAGKHGNGWADIGYHFLVDQYGLVHRGRAIDVVGAHARGFNSQTIGICGIGNNTNRWEAWTRAQRDQIVSLVGALRMVLGPRIPVVLHGDLMPTACPGLSEKQWENLRIRLAPTKWKRA
jgi:hypothetical protein